jgi:PAS domain S-box-containing protein
MLQKLVNGAHGRRPVWAGRLGLAIIVGLAYFFAAQLGLALLTAAERVAVFWPASGIAAGALIALGPWARAPIAFAVVVASAAAALLSERSIGSAFALGLCNAGEALLVAWLVRHRYGPVFNLDSLIHVLSFFAAAAVGTAIAALGASGAMKLFGPSTASFSDIWEIWFASDALGLISVAPLLIGIAAAVREPPSWSEALEGTVAVAALTMVYGLALALLTGPWSLIAPATFVFPLLLWVGSRCRPVFASAAAFMVAAAVVWTTIHEWGRYGDPSQPIGDRVLAAQSTILGTTLAALALAGVFAERRRHEGVARENEARLRSILDAANVLAWDVDLVRNAVHSAGPVRRLLDRPEDLVPRDFAAMVETIHPEDRDAVMSQFWAAVGRGTNFRLEFRLNSDALRWVTAEGSIERDGDGRPVRVRAITHDVTERKNAELALSERDAQLWLAGEAARVGSFAIDIGTGRVQSSPGYAVIHGLAEGTKESLREEWRTRVHPDDLGRLDLLLNQALAERRRAHNTEYRIVAPDGRVRWIESRSLISYDGAGQPTRIVGVNIDMTERKRVEEQQSQLVAELDHRVKNVLATVAVVARRTSDHTGSTSDFIEALDHRLQSMAEAHSLLSRNRWRGVNLADLVAQELTPFTVSGNATAEGPTVCLSAAATQAMAMVLHELATNAAKYGALSTPQGRVSVRWHRLSEGVTPAKLRLEWRELGGPRVTVPAKSGFGTSVIRDLIPYELGGTVELEFAPSGVLCIIEIATESDPDRPAIRRLDPADTHSSGNHIPGS